MKSLFLSVVLVFALTLPALGGEFKTMDKLTILDSVGYSRNVSGSEAGNGGTAGIFIGNLAGYYSEGLQIVGLGGFLVQAASKVGETSTTKENEREGVSFAISFTPLTFFENSIQLGYGYNFTDQTGMLTVGMSLTRLLGGLTD